MTSFCVNTNAQSNGDHEVHDTSVERPCLPAASHRLDLGQHSGCASAVTAAKVHYPQSNGCARCAPECNTG